MPRWKPTMVTALSIALPLFALSLVAPMMWWRQAPPSPALESAGYPPAASVPSAAVEIQPLSIGWEESPREEPLQTQELAEIVPQSQYVRTESHVDEEPAGNLPALVGPDNYAPLAFAIATESATELPEVIREEAETELPSVTSEVPDLNAEASAPSREPAKIVPEEMIEPSPAVPAPVWPQADSLVLQINRLAELEPDFAAWCERLETVLGDLRRQGELNSSSSQQLLADLAELKALGEKDATARQGKPAAARVMRVTFALSRRLALWEVAAQWDEAASPLPALPTTHEWQSTLRAVSQFLQTGQAGPTWVKFLRLPELKFLADETVADSDRRLLARDVLRRMSSSQLNGEQHDLMQSPPFDRLQAGLEKFAAEPLNVSALLANLEAFETAPLSVHAKPVAHQYEIARWSANPVERDLADQLNAHYRNANVRVALSADLLNRVLPQMTRTKERVSDNILGAAVHGQSQTATRLRLVLFPDRWRWRFGLEARGEVSTSTASTKGPATFYQDGYSQFRARKELTIDRRSISLFNAEASASSNNTLRDYQTDYDSIPIFNAIARQVARQEYEEQSPLARYEVENKIAGRASRTLDSQVDARVNQASNQLKSQLLAPLQELDLDPTAIDMETTQSRLIARYRLAGHEQLGSSTPRPQAPGDSMLSVQLHQSAINNVLQHLHLEGQKKELRTLYAEMTALFVRKEVPIPEDIPEGVFATFADTDAVRIDAEKGKVRVTIRLVELKHESSQWRNFTVRAYYAPDPDQKSANLVRDGVIELIGKNLRLGDQIALRGIFSRVLSRNRNINLINEQLAKSKALKDLHVSQFAIQDGWVGIALAAGPQRPILYTRPPVPAKEQDGDDEEVARRPLPSGQEPSFR